MEPELYSLPPKKNRSYGAVIGIFLILAVIVMGALYAYHTRVAPQAAPSTLPA